MSWMNKTASHILCFVGAILFTHCVALTAIAQMGTQKEGLRGVKSLSVSVQSLDRTVITDEHLQVQIELRLRQAGLSVSDCKVGTVCLPQVHVKLIAIAMSERVMYCLIRVEFNTLVAPIGQPTHRLLATVWLNEKGMVALKNDYGPVTDEINQLIDEFVK